MPKQADFIKLNFEVPWSRTLMKRLKHLYPNNVPSIKIPSFTKPQIPLKMNHTRSALPAGALPDAAPVHKQLL